MHAFATVSLAALAAASDPPAWPRPIAAVWPTRWVSHNYTGDFPLGPAPFDKVTLVGSWYYNWPTNQWRQDTCVKNTPDSPPDCKISLWSGNDHTAGSQDVGTTYVWKDGKCTYSASMVPSITHPDSFANAAYSGREMADGAWGDRWVADTHKWIHYNFSSLMNVDTAHPMRDCGPTMTSPPWAYACSRHHHVQTGDQFTDAEWANFFALDTSTCTLAVMTPGVSSLWPGALLQTRGRHA